jgi:protein SCO1/2
VTFDRRRFLGLAAGGAAAAALAGCGLADSSAPDLRNRTDDLAWGGQLVDPPFQKPDFTFTDMFGDPFDFVAETEGRFTILFFGYTSCPDVCPIYLQTISRAIEAIGTGPGSDPLVLFVGVDVARDTPEQLQTYLGRINPTFVGLTGSAELVDEAHQAMSMGPIVIEEPDEDGNYLVGHGSKVFPFLDQDVAPRIYPYDVRQNEWVRDLPRLAEGQYQ